MPSHSPTEPIDSAAVAAVAAASGAERSFVAVSRFVVANGMEAEVREAFADRPGLVDSAPGFRRMEVLRPVDRPEEFWLLTYWRDEASFRDWHRGHAYRDSHAGIPKGLKLDPRATRITYFESIPTSRPCPISPQS